ncbi:MAG: transposase [Negativicutes bacterium]
MSAVASFLPFLNILAIASPDDSPEPIISRIPYLPAINWVVGIIIRLHETPSSCTKLLRSNINTYRSTIKDIELLDTLYEKNWIVYCIKPFKSCSYVIEYPGRYTHRVAYFNQSDHKA